MATIIYVLCTLTSMSCAWLLLRSYIANKSRLLFWSGLCFVGLTINNVLLVLDKLVFRDVDLSTLRLLAALFALLLMLYGLIWEEE